MVFETCGGLDVPLMFRAPRFFSAFCAVCRRDRFEAGGDGWRAGC